MDMPDPDDLLSAVLSAYQLKAGVYGNPRFCGLWQHSTAGMRRGVFHLIGAGECWLHTRQGLPPQQMHAGDLVVLPHDAWHMLTGHPSLAGDTPHASTETEGPFTTMVCGYFDFQAGNRNPVLDALPEVILVSSAEGGELLELLSKLLISECERADVGTRTVLDKLADTLFVMVVRHHIQQSSDLRGVLAGLADTRLGRVLAAMHQRPGQAWNVEALAEVAEMSRTNFVQLFSERIGHPPMDYLTRWRMTQAELLLKNPSTSVARVAEQMGYESESAFRKAYKRIHGVGPGSVRRWLRGKLIESS